jgi:hypothetical protein
MTRELKLDRMESVKSTFVDCVLEGTFLDSFGDDSQALWYATSPGHNNFTNITFANPVAPQ